MFGKGVAIDTVDLKKKLRNVAQETRIEAAKIAVESLEGMVKAIQGKTANRRSLIMRYRNTPYWWVAWRLGKGTQDNPLEGARVETKATRSAQGGRRGRLVVYVYHQTKGVKKPVNLFDVLDSGVKTRRARKRFKYPVAESNMFTVPGPVGDAFADPRQAESYMSKARIQYARYGAEPHLQPNNISSVEKQGIAASIGNGGRTRPLPLFKTVKPGESIPGFRGKKFYEAVADYVEKELLRRGIVTPKNRTKVKLKRNDVVVRARRINKAK